MKIIPAVDIIDGKTVRLEQGRYDKELSYDMSPVEAAKQWEAMGAELLHVVDLDGAKMGRPVNLSVIENIVKAVNIPVEVGGGYRTTEDIQQALDKGLWRVIVGSRAFEDMEFAAECAKTFGDKVIFSVDVKNLKASVHGWERTVEVDVYKEFIPFLIKCGAREVIYTDISRDGMLSGPNIAALKHVLEHVNIRIISAGGVKNVEHVRQLKKLEAKPGDDYGVSGVIVGRALYDGTIDLKEAIDAGKADNPVS